MLTGAVSGYGNMGQQLVGRINSTTRFDARVVAASDILEVNRAKARSAGLRVIEDPTNLQAESLDFVIVSSTTIAHAEQVVAAANVGCHIFCEKPVALTLDDADRMIASTESRNLVTVVNYITRFNPGYQYLRRLIESGDLGSVLSIVHHRLRGFGLFDSGARHSAVLEPKRSGGWTVHHACHDTDLLLWLGGPVASAYGVTASTGAPSEELVSALLRFESGAVAHIEDSVCGLREHYTRIIGSEASVVLTGENENSVCRLKREGRETEERLAVEDRKEPEAALAHFFDCIRDNRRSPVDLRSARESLAVALAIQRSAREGRPVSFPDSD